MGNGIETNREFLGAGLAFPLRLDDQGRLAMNSMDDHVRQSILMILETAPGERVMRPDFGGGLNTLAFEPINPTTIGLVQHQVKNALVRFEPRIDVLDVQVTASKEGQGLLLITVQYRVRSTDTIFNLVYPFYVDRGEV